MREVILASASERRSRILSECGIDHRVVVTGIEENSDKDKHVSDVVVLNAEMKAEDAASSNKGAIIIGADTLVSHGGSIIGKPSSEEHARDMLVNFSGADVDVYTGMCVIDTDSGRKASGYDKSSLRVATVPEDELDRFFMLLAPYDKAGGFSIEGAGALLFDNISGSYFNILGLSMMKLKDLFPEAGLNILDCIKL